MTFHEDVFYEYFRPFRHPDAAFDDIWGGHGLETYGKDLVLVRGYDPNHIWTVLDCDSGQMIVPGYHHVNRVCYILTELPHMGAPIEFRVARPIRFLSPLGLARRIATLRRVIVQASSGLTNVP